MGALDKVWRGVGRVLVGVSDKPGLYKYGRDTAGPSPLAIARHYGLDATEADTPAGKKVVLTTPAGNTASISRYDTPQAWRESIGNSYRTEDEAARMARAYSRLDRPVTDINTLDASRVSTAPGEGGRLYRALYDINADWDAINSTGVLSRSNRGRRTEHMLSALLRDPGVGERLLIDPYQVPHVYDVRGDTARSQLKFASMPVEEKVAMLARTSMLNADAATSGALSHFRLSPIEASADDYLDMSGHVGALNAAINRYVSGGRPAGESTLRRAALIDGIRGDVRRGVDEDELIDAILGSKDPYYSDLFYAEGGVVA